jgi:hypothetical protein
MCVWATSAALDHIAAALLDRATLGPPWTKDHWIALAATIVGG